MFPADDSVHSAGSSAQLKSISGQRISSALFIFPVIGVSAAFEVAGSVRNRRDGVPSYTLGLIFAVAVSTLTIWFWPDMIRFAGEGVFVFPPMRVCAVISYSVFRGKVQPITDDY